MVVVPVGLRIGPLMKTLPFELTLTVPWLSPMNWMPTGRALEISWLSRTCWPKNASCSTVMVVVPYQVVDVSSGLELYVVVPVGIVTGFKL